MRKLYKVTHVPHFIGGRMVYPDRGQESITELPEGVEPGRWLEEVKGGKAQPAKKQGEQQDDDGDAAPQYKAKHNGGGRYVILDANGEKFSDFTGNKEEALAEEERLNKGGAPYVAPQDKDDEQDNRNLPDA